MPRTHGRVATYIAGCRCEDCRGASTDYHRERRRVRTEQRENGVAVADEIVHGRNSTYCNHSCRCDECREAHRIYGAEIRKRYRECTNSGSGAASVPGAP